MIDFRKYYWLLCTCSTIIGTTIAWIFKFYEDKGALTALVDVTLTFIALTIAILEILELRNIAESSRLAVEGALGRITELFSVADITKGIKTAYDIQKYLRSNEFHIAHIRMQDLKSIVIPLKNDKRFEALDLSKQLPDILFTLSVDIKNVESTISGLKNKSMDITKMNGNLENLVSVLIEYENYIKFFKS